MCIAITNLQMEEPQGLNQVRNTAKALVIETQVERGKTRSLDCRDLLEIERNESPMLVTRGIAQRC